jgi:tetratricopeptide (TPR) repeat protein
VLGASQAWREVQDRPPPAREAVPPPPGRAGLAERAFGGEAVLDDDELRQAATGAVRRGETGRSRRAEERSPVEEVRDELSRAVGTTRGPRLDRRLADAARAFERERFGDAARILRPLASEAPSVAAVRELYGLTLYRQGRWRAAAKELEAFRLLTGSAEQHPVLADCYRALERWDDVDALWLDLRETSPSAALVVEGRIVAAGARADQGDLAGAIAVLEQGWKRPKRPQEHHLRRAYALADLYERAGDVARAREVFGWLASVAPETADVARRLRSL